MKTFWKIVKFIGQVIPLAIAAFAGSALSGCALIPQFIF